MRRYAPRLLDAFAFKAAPVAQKVLDGIDTLRAMNQANARSVPKDAPMGFLKPRWEQQVLTDDGIDRRFYELCALSELKNALRSGDVWVPGSRLCRRSRPGPGSRGGSGGPLGNDPRGSPVVSRGADDDLHVLAEPVEEA
jgi:hypothetical protein